MLNSGQAGLQTVTITLTATCDTSGAQQIPSGQPGMRRFERPLSLVPRYSGVRYYTFPGGCATYPRDVTCLVPAPAGATPTRRRLSPSQRPRSQSARLDNIRFRALPSATELTAPGHPDPWCLP